LGGPPAMLVRSLCTHVNLIVRNAILKLETFRSIFGGFCRDIESAILYGILGCPARYAVQLAMHPRYRCLIA
jgi:hypothetical protein